MATNQVAVKGRLNGGTKVSMILVAVVLDLLPFFALPIAFMFILNMAGLDAGTVAECAAYHANGPEQKVGFLPDFADWAKFDWGGTKACGKTVVAVALGGSVSFVFGVALIAMASFASVLLAYVFIFPLWFGLNKVNVFAIGGRRMLINFFGFITESIPFINIIAPGITIWTIAQISVAHHEDKVRAKKGKTKKGGRRKQRGLQQEDEYGDSYFEA